MFALSEKGPVYFFKGHPTLKRGIAIKLDCYLIPKSRVEIIKPCSRKTICKLYPQYLRDLISRILSLILFRPGFFCSKAFDDVSPVLNVEILGVL